MIFALLFHILIHTSAHANGPTCFGAVALPDIPDDVSALLQRNRAGCLIEDNLRNPKSGNREVCRCLDSKTAVTRHQFNALSNTLRPTLEDMYLQKTGERFRSKIFSTFNDLLILDARIKQGLGLNQNYLSITDNCRLSRMKEAMDQLAADANCPRNIFEKRKRLILGDSSVDAFLQNTERKIEGVMLNGIPRELQEQQYCLSYKGFMAIKEPPLQTYRDFQTLHDAPVGSNPNEKDYDRVRLSLARSSTYYSSLYLASPNTDPSYYDIVTNHQGNTESFLQEYDLQRHFQEARQDGMMTRLITEHPAFMRKLRNSPDANHFFFEKSTNLGMLTIMNNKCQQLFAPENLRSLFCQNTFPNMNLETLVKELGPEVHRSPLGKDFGDRINEVTASTFLCQINANDRISTSNTYTNNPTAWDDILSPQQHFQSDLEILSDKFDRTKRPLTSYEVLNEKFCRFFNQAGLTGSDGHMNPSALNMEHVRGMMEYYGNTYFGGTAREKTLARVRSEIFPLLDQIAANPDQFGIPHPWDQLQEKIRSIIGIDEAPAITAMINRVVRTRQREDYALRQHYKSVYPDAADPLIAAVAAKGSRDSALAEARTSSPPGSSIDRLINPSRYESGWEEPNDSGASIFTNYFLTGDSSAESRLEEHRSTTLDAFYREGTDTAGTTPTSSPLDMSWTAPTSGSPTSASANVPFERSIFVTEAATALDPTAPVRSDASTVVPAVNATVNPIQTTGGDIAPDLATNTPLVSNAESPLPSRPAIIRSPAPQPVTVPLANTPGPIQESSFTNELLQAPPVSDNTVGQTPAAPADLTHPLEDDLASLRGDVESLDDTIARILPESPTVPPVRRRPPAPTLLPRQPNGNALDGANREPANAASNPYSLPRSPYTPNPNGLSDANISELSQAPAGRTDNAIDAKASGGGAGGAAGGKTTGNGKSGAAIAKAGGAASGAGGTGKGPGSKKAKELKNLHAYEENYIYPHGILDAHMLGEKSQDYQLFHEFVTMMGLEGKRWSTIESITDTQTNTIRYVLRTFDLSWPQANEEQKAKLQDSDYRNKLVKNAGEWRSKNDRSSLSRLAQKSKLVREIPLSEEKFHKMRVYLAGREEIMERIYQTAIPQ